MADSDGVRQTRRVLRAGKLYRLIERIPQEILARFRLDGDEAISMLGFQLGLQLLGGESLGTINDRFCLG